MHIEQAIITLTNEIVALRKTIEANPLSLPEPKEAPKAEEQKPKAEAPKPKPEAKKDPDLALTVAELAKLKASTGERSKIKALVCSIEFGADKISDLSQEGLLDLQSKLEAL